ncbi:cysteinyl-tRNA synthetase [Kytococcus aerolatus]|uniref:Cysteine--tRNA ligase n=1 Tax=Kytococcus aerolatus TaxID=592308 RepID=A0A212U694_9MICO|nr:cysteine--tRNA ligase [Kytococcus aerolatus]SNC73611.1 cysteinyl-tRNA synthetase [Kytococcus aerolatus]
MTLRLHDSATREIRDFVPRVPGRASIYICGLTTQASPHIGHLRFTVAFDVLRRWMERGHGLEVTLVRNVTDIDDKILTKSAEHGVAWNEWSQRFERETTAALEVLGVRPPSYEPRATGHVPDMIELMERLVERGHAYPAADGSGDVYFDVRSWPAYGELTRQRIEDMAPAADADPRGKRDPRDFALWKGAKADEPHSATWPTPWGRGRPGWHLECSAMSWRWLGEEFDIHGGGNDLRFPHHENEQAQSRAAGFGFARYWMHNGMLTTGGEKMSKSIGNTLTITELTKDYRPLAVRWLLTAVHYRSALEYTPGSLAEATAQVERVEGFLHRAAEAAGEEPASLRQAGLTGELPADFVAALDDDVNVPAGLAVVFDHVRRGNTALARGEAGMALELARTTSGMLDVLGIDPLDPHWAGETGEPGGSRAEEVLAALLDERLQARACAKAEKDFATADSIRDQLAALGVTVQDGPQGATWELGPAPRPTNPAEEA